LYRAGSFEVNEQNMVGSHHACCALQFLACVIVS
jgi:hypothetical protein